MSNPVNPAPYCTKAYLTNTLEDQTLAGRWLAAGGPRWVTLLDEAFFVLGALIFLVGSFDFFPGVPFAQRIEGCELFIVGSVIFLGLSLFNAFEIAEDAKLANKPPEFFDLFEEFLYFTGSALFVAGTILFTPPLQESALVAEEAAKAISAAASALDAPPQPLLSVQWFGQTIDVMVNEKGELPEAAEVSLEKGDLLFVIGSVLYSMAAFVSGLKAAGDQTVGPGAALRRRTAVASASLYELGGVAFVVGTLGFIPAQALGIAACPSGTELIQRSGAQLFVLGSSLYLAGSSLTLAVTASLTYDGLEDVLDDATTLPDAWTSDKGALCRRRTRATFAAARLARLARQAQLALQALQAL